MRREPESNLPRTIFGVWLYMKMLDMIFGALVFVLFWFVLVPLITGRL